MSGSFVWTDARVREALGLDPDPRTRELTFTGISTDTRTLDEGALFVALKGERFDAHGFLDQAVAAGARGAVVSEAGAGVEGLPLYQVADTLVALGDLARFRRKGMSWRVVAITGSSGKTTVKDALAAALAPSFRVHATRGNLNNRVGVPLTVLEAPAEARFLVLELATNEPGEIGILTAVVEPDASLVVTVSETHLEGLGSLDGVLVEKLALMEGTRDEGPVLVGDEPPVLADRARALRPDVRVAGFSPRADEDLQGELLDCDDDGHWTFRFQDREVRGALPGRHGAMNLLLALSMAHLLGADLDDAVAAAASVHPGHMRGESLDLGDLRLILDCYNANPQSMEAALSFLAELSRPGEKVAFLGSMLELGERAPEFHREVLDRARELPLCAVVGVGEFHEAVAGEAAPGEAQGPLILLAPTPDEGYDRLRPYLTGTETVLLKASRGVALERLVDRFREDFGPSSSSDEEA
jgi:UDP-N-acetylmuramoyl-tripeptide--D-alanyl-D-alanine ligase